MIVPRLPGSRISSSASHVSALAKALYGKDVGDEVTAGGGTAEILAVEAAEGV